MIFNLSLDKEEFSIDIPDALLTEVEPIVKDMDGEYDRGVQMGRYWVDNPSDEERCQVAANDLVNALHAENKRMVYLLAAYILTKFPKLKIVVIDTDLEIQEIDIQE